MAVTETEAREKQVAKKAKEDDAKLLNILAELGGSRQATSDVVFEGKKFILPENTTVRKAIQFLEQFEQDTEQRVSFSRTFKYRPYDAAHALAAVFSRVAGMWVQKPSMGFWGPTPPRMISIQVGPKPSQTAQVPWGEIAIPFLPGVTFETGSHREPNLGVIFRLDASGPKKYRFQIEGIFKMLEEELRTNSIYRGQALDASDTPEFIDLSGVDERRVTYSDEVMAQLQANVWTTIEHASTLRELGMPIKRAVLCEGPYGTGKTLAAYLTAKRAVMHHWTFIYVKPKQNLIQALQTARLYAPAVVFFEDLDALDTEGTDQTSVVLDAFDGITSKGVEILTLLTTNHPEAIHKGMVRPGRLDAVIHIGSLDQNGIQRLIESHISPNVLGDLDFGAIYQAMEGFVPAFAVEAIGRAQRYAIARTGEKPKRLETSDFVEAARGLRPQLDLMNGAGSVPKPTIDGLMTTYLEEAKAETFFFCGECQRSHRHDDTDCRLLKDQA